MTNKNQISIEEVLESKPRLRILKEISKNNVKLFKKEIMKKNDK